MRFCWVKVPWAPRHATSYRTPLSRVPRDRFFSRCLGARMCLGSLDLVSASASVGSFLNAERRAARVRLPVLAFWSPFYTREILVWTAGTTVATTRLRLPSPPHSSFLL